MIDRASGFSTAPPSMEVERDEADGNTVMGNDGGLNPILRA